MVAYGYSFNIGLMNYYLWLGLACFGLEILWRGRGIDWIAGGLIAALAWLAHPIGFLWLLGMLVYVKIRAKLPRWWKLAMPLAVAVGFATVCWYTSPPASFSGDLDRGPFYFFKGADQLGVFGTPYFLLAGSGIFFWGVFAPAAPSLRKKGQGSWR